MIQGYARQRGLILIMLAVSMTTLLAMVGLALDVGHAYLNKTRAQNLADALVLAGAKVLNASHSQTQAHTAMAELFTRNVNAAGNKELRDKLVFQDITIQYSSTLYPFVAGSQNPRYVRVLIQSFSLQSWFIRVLGINSIPITASAIAGPSVALSPIVCHAAPLLACGDANAPPAADGSFWGYTPGVIQVLKATSQNKSECVGAGNFHLVSLDDANGADGVRESLAGNQQSCTDFSQGITTKPGNTVGPSIQGLNTRFGEYQGAMGGRQAEFPPDVVTTEAQSPISLPKDSCVGEQAVNLDFNWSQYQQAVANGSFNHTPPTGVFGRRILQVPIGDCANSSKAGGKTSVPYLGVGCFFLLKKIGSQQSSGSIYGEFIEDCSQDGVVGKNPGETSGPFKILLYENTQAT